MLQNEYFLVKIGADTAENGLQKDPKTGPLKDVNGDMLQTNAPRPQKLQNSDLLHFVS